MATPSKTVSIEDYFTEGDCDFKWHKAVNLILERWDETNKILRQLADKEAFKSYEEGLEAGKEEAREDLPQPREADWRD